MEEKPLPKHFEIGTIVEDEGESKNLLKPKRYFKKRSPKHDEVLRKEISSVIKKLLQPLSTRKKSKESYEKKSINHLPYTSKKSIFALPQKTRSKSVSKKRYYRAKHLATFDTIKKLLKLHKERKYSTGFQTPMMIPNSLSESPKEGKLQLKPLNITTDDVASFYSLNKGGKSPSEYNSINKDVMCFSKNYARIKQITENTLRLRNLEQGIYNGSYSQQNSASRQKFVIKKKNNVEKTKEIKKEEKMQELPKIKTTESFSAPLKRFQRQVNESSEDSKQKRTKRRSMIYTILNTNLDDQLKQLGKKIDLLEKKPEKTTRKKNVTFDLSINKEYTVS